MRKLTPVNSPSPSPTTGPIFFPPLPFADSALDVATLALTLSLLLLSLLSLSSILHLRLKSRSSPRLKNFNSLWSVRLLLVLLILLWSLSETLRLPSLYRHRLSLNQQSGLCKIHLVLSLGLLQPGFLTALLFLLNASVRNKKPFCPVGTILAACLPVALLQALFVFFAPFEDKLPDVFYSSSVLSTGDDDLVFSLCRCVRDGSTLGRAGRYVGFSSSSSSSSSILKTNLFFPLKIPDSAQKFKNC